MRRTGLILLFLLVLIGSGLYLKSVDPVPPCDEYLTWCYDWCAQHYQDYERFQQCLNECARKYLEWCK